MAIDIGNYTASQEPDPRTIFTDGRWQCYRSPSVTPHNLFVLETPTGNYAVLTQVQGDSDWALNKGASQYVLNNKTLVKAWVAQTENRTVLRYLELKQVLANIGNIEPWDGPYGLFWWLDEKFTPPEPMRRLRRVVNENDPW